MSLDRATTTRAAATLLTPVVHAPLVPAVELSRNPQAGQLVFDWLGDSEGLRTTHQLFDRIKQKLTSVTVADKQLPVPSATVALAAGDEPVSLRN
jgi:hypothetical protein